MKDSTKVSTTVSITEEVLSQAREIALSERRSFSAQVEIWMEEKISEEAKKLTQPTQTEKEGK